MIAKYSLSAHRKRRNGIHRVAPVEPLSARIIRLRIARGYSVYELAREAGIFAGTIQGLESGKNVDKCVLRLSQLHSACRSAGSYAVSTTAPNAHAFLANASKRSGDRVLETSY